MTTDDTYFERGINLRHGYLTEYYADSAEYLVKLPKELRSVGVLMEPMSVAEKLRAIRELTAAGVPTGVMVAPLVPGLTDEDVPQILAAAAEAGARPRDWYVRPARIDDPAASRARGRCNGALAAPVPQCRAAR